MNLPLKFEEVSPAEALVSLSAQALPAEGVLKLALRLRTVLRSEARDLLQGCRQQQPNDKLGKEMLDDERLSHGRAPQRLELRLHTQDRRNDHDERPNHPFEPLPARWASHPNYRRSGNPVVLREAFARVHQTAAGVGECSLSVSDASSAAS